MEYTDIEDGHPTRQAMYHVLIHNMDTGAEREARADFRLASGNFLPIDTNVAHNEYVRAWKPIVV